MNGSPPPIVDPVELTQALIRRPSVTPADAGAMDTLQRVLEGLGFSCRRMPFEGPSGTGSDARIENLYARRGTDSPNLCFAGHTDVVPTGDTGAWSSEPFEGEVRDGILYGRGAVDMKGGIAAWVAAVSQVLAEGEPDGSLSFLITGDEEGPALHGTKRVVETLMAEGEVIDACVVGEPSSQQALGDMIKVGLRGSLNTWITVHGKQGHVAYPDRAANPAPVMARLLAWLVRQPEVSLADLCYTMQLGRANLRYRLCVVFGTREELAAGLDAYLAGTDAPGVHHGQGRAGSVAQALPGELGTLSQAAASGLAAQWCQGVEFDWLSGYGPARPYTISAPAYPFERVRHWIGAPIPEAAGGEPPAADVPAGAAHAGADAAEQAQAGADIEQQRRFLEQRDLGRVLQHRQCDRVERLGFARGIALVDPRFGHEHEHAAAPHAAPDAGRARRC